MRLPMVGWVGCVCIGERVGVSAGTASKAARRDIVSVPLCAALATNQAGLFASPTFSTTEQEETETEQQAEHTGEQGVDGFENAGARRYVRLV